MRKQLVKTIEETLSNDNKLVLLLGDIGVFGFRNSFKTFPDRVYNIGILEQSTISLASGMATNGLIPVVHTIAPFLVERALEQLKVDFGYQNLNGNFISIGASYDYAALGSTHHCPADVMLLQSIPNMQIVTPGTSLEFEYLFQQTYNNGSPTYFRLSEYENNETHLSQFGKGVVIKKGFLATIICFGNILDNVIKATEDLNVTILYYNTVNPFDTELLLENCNQNIIICEPFYEGSVNYKITKALSGRSYRLNNIGVSHKFLTNYGSKLQHDEALGLDANGLKNKIEECLI